MDYSFLAGLGAGITGGNQGFNQAQQREYEGEQQEFENRRQQALLGLALAKQQLDENNARVSQAREQQQLDLNKGNQQYTHAMGLANAFGGQQMPESAVSGLGPWKDVISKPVAPSEGTKIYTSPDASPDSLQTVGKVAPGQVELAQPFNTKLAVAQLNNDTRQAALEHKNEYDQQILQLRDAAQATTDAFRKGQLETMAQRLEIQRDAQAANEALKGTKATAALHGQYHKEAQPYEDGFTQYRNLTRGLAMIGQNPDDTGAQNLVMNAYRALENNKVFAPRMATIAQETEHQGYGNQLAGWVHAKLAGHGGYNLAPGVAEGFKTIMDPIVSGRVGEYQAIRDLYTKTAAGSGRIDPEDVIGKHDYSEGLFPTGAPTPWLAGPQGTGTPGAVPPSPGGTSLPDGYAAYQAKFGKKK